MMRFLNSKSGRIFTILLILFLLVQLIPRPGKNQGQGFNSASVNKIYPVSDSVMSILKSACYDCHSNHTNYPWYNNIQPVAWYLNRHITEGKKDLNFDEFGSYSRRRQQSKLRSIISEVRDGKMPLKSYKLMHPEAKLRKEERELIITWALGHSKNE